MFRNALCDIGIRIEKNVARRRATSQSERERGRDGEKRMEREQRAVHFSVVDVITDAQLEPTRSQSVER